MINIEHIGEINLRPIEYCLIVGDQDFNNKKFKISIPKLMQNTININDNVINKDIFSNAPDCKPQPNNVKLQNYITVKKSTLCSLPVKESTDNIVPDNTQIICQSVNGNIKDMLIIDYVDTNDNDDRTTFITKSDTEKMYYNKNEINNMLSKIMEISDTEPTDITTLLWVKPID